MDYFLEMIIMKKNSYAYYIRIQVLLLIPLSIFFTVEAQDTVSVKKDSVNSNTLVAIDRPFGKREKSLVSASISSVAGERITSFPVQTLDQSLPGLIPGLTVIGTGFEPGRESSILRIRGQHSYQNNEPLVFVDGLEATMDQLSVYEVDRISVFKDAASLAPFGMRGANGVIWVTTKRGNQDRMVIDFNSRSGISKPIGLPSFVGSYDYARLFNEAVSNDMGVWSPRYSATELEKYQTDSDPLFYPNVDWQKEVLKDYTINNETNLSFRGSVSRMKYFVMMGYLSTPKLFKKSDEDGNLSDKSSTRRFNIRSNIDVAINKIFDASISIGGSIVDNARPNVGSVWGAIAATPPNAYQPKNPDGSWSGNSTYMDNPAGAVFGLGRLSNSDRRIQTIFTLQENLGQFVPDLTLRQSIGFDNMNSATYNATQNYARFFPRINEAGDTTYVQYGNNVAYTTAQGSPTQFWRVAYQAEANYTKNINKHKFSTSLNYRFRQLYNTIENPPFNDLAIFGNINYDYDKKYFSDVTVAYSGSENFAPGKRFGLFPAFSVGWNISEESFMKNISWINYLKIKGSVGTVGNSDIGAWRFLYQGYYPAGSNYILANSGTRSVATLIEGAIGSKNATWEKSTIVNLGVETNAFDNKLDFAAEVFYEKRSDILTRREASTFAVSGIGAPYENIGKVENKGFEISGSWNDRGGAVKYGVSTVFSMARNKIKYQDEIVRSADYLYRTGNPIGQVFALEATGLFQSIEEINNSSTPLHTFGPVQPGDIRYKDQNNDGIINEDDMIAVGYANNIPEITGSLGGWISYKRFDMNFLFSGMANRTLYITGNNLWAFSNDGQVPELALNRWVYYPEQGLDTRNTATYPRLSASGSLNNDRISTFWLKNGNFLRLRNVEIGYTFPLKQKTENGISKLRLYVSGINLLTFSKLGNWDPEAFPGTYPITPSAYLGINVTF